MIPKSKRFTTLQAALSALSLSAAASAYAYDGELASESLFPELPKAFADFDGDGLMDALALELNGAPRLLRNLGQAGFEDATAAAGLTDIGAARGASWHDVDGDGRVDLTLFTPEGGVRVLYNSPEGLFAEGTEGSGLEYARGVVAARWADLDGDGLSELWTGDGQAEQLWHNAGDGTFAELPLPEAGSGGGAGGGSLGLSGPGGYVINSSPGNPLGLLCLPRIVDQAGGCLVASSTPTMGKLFPLSASTVPGLSADKLDGLDSSTFSQLGQTIEGSEISAGAIGSSELAPDSVDSGHVILNSLTGFDIQDGSITDKELAPDSVDAWHIAPAGVGGSELAPDSVNSGHVILNSLTGFDIQDGSITDKELAQGSVDAWHIAPAGVGGSEIAPNAIGSGHILDGTIGGTDIAWFTILDNHISTSAGISGTKISPNFGSQDVSTSGNLTVGGGFQSGSLQVTGNFAASGNVGAGTTNPLEDLHVIGSSTMGTALIAPADPVGGDDSQLILAENDVGTFGMRMAFDGGTNQMSIDGVNAGVPTTHWQLTRDSGRLGIGAAPAADTRVNIDDDNRYGVRVTANSTSGGVTYGVSSVNSGALGIGVYGEASDSTGTGAGVQGVSSAPLGLGVSCIGNFLVTGIKAFTQPHPQDASKELRFVCLEGNESGTYFRGSSKLVGGEAIIDVPEDFRLVTEAGGMTVQVTAVGLPAALYVVSKDLDHIVVRGAGGSGDVDFDYFVNGVRRGFQDHQVLRDNQSFVPTERGVPFGTQYPDAFRQILVNNGTLNPDFTPNEATAAQHGWVLRDPAPAGPLEPVEAPAD